MLCTLYFLQCSKAIISMNGENTLYLNMDEKKHFFSGEEGCGDQRALSSQESLFPDTQWTRPASPLFS